jgi:hypothetical protein
MASSPVLIGGVPLPALVFASAADLGEELVSKTLMPLVRDAAERGAPCVLGCPAGRTAQSTYQALVNAVAADPKATWRTWPSP